MDAAVKASINKALAVVRRQMRRLSPRIASLFDGDPPWRVLKEAFREIKGVADPTVATLPAELPEIGTLSNNSAGKLTGLAPLARDSCKLVGKRSIRGGRAPVPAILFVVTGLVRPCHPDFADFRRRLSEAGKPKKAIRVALARKLIVRLNAKARDVCKQLQPAA